MSRKRIATLRVDKKGAVHRLVVEVEEAIGLKLELCIGQQREEKSAFFLVRFQRLLEIFRRSVLMATTAIPAAANSRAFWAKF